VIRVQSVCERRADSDASNDRFRLWVRSNVITHTSEVPGLGLALSAEACMDAEVVGSASRFRYSDLGNAWLRLVQPNLSIEMGQNGLSKSSWLGYSGGRVFKASGSTGALM